MNTDTDRTSPAQSTSGLDIKDIMTAAAMLVLSMGCNSIIAMIALPLPIVYLYLAAPIEMFVGATFYLVAANRINKHGLLFVWVAVPTASAGGFSEQLLDMFRDISTNPWLLILACGLSMIGGFLGVLFGQKLLRRHFRKAGVVG